MSSSRKLKHHDYTVGWISALPLEMATAKAMLNEVHTSLPVPKSDHNTYRLGKIANHNIVIACLPSGVYGHTSVAVAAQQMRSTFPSINFGLMVGIGGGAPNDSVDIRLGDVVVSKPTDRFGGVVQYDYGKTLADGAFHRTGTLNKPPEALLTAISDLQANHIMGENHITSHLQMAAEAYPCMRSSFIYPGQDQDILFKTPHRHQGSNASCCGCDCSKTMTRSPRQSTEPRIHYGLIASANQVMKDASTRDQLARELGVLCYEMEAAGLMDHFPCLVIRGICDYSDSHKNKQWQNYAAATAAAYAKELLQFSIPSTGGSQRQNSTEKIRTKVPILKTKFFGRQIELVKTRQYFNSPKPGQKAVVVWGLSGYGKTQLAIHYITTEQESYQSILWIDSSSTAMIDESFERISSQIRPDSRHERPAVDRVVEWLEQDTNRSWIMVFDGIPSFDDMSGCDGLDIRKYLPSCDHGHLLLITTASDLQSRLGFPEIQLQGVDDHTGSEILLKCAGIRSSDSSVRVIGKAISRKLDGVPLALEQAGSFLSYGLISMSDYNQQFQIRFLDKALKTPVRRYVGSYEKGRTLWTAFDMLYDALSQRSLDSIRLLNLAAFLGPGQIQFSVLSGPNGSAQTGCSETSITLPSDISNTPSCSVLTWLERLRSETTDFAFALGELESSGFIKLSRNSSDANIDTFIIHDLVRSFIRFKMSREDTLENVAAAFILTGRALHNSNKAFNDAVMRKHIGRLYSVLNNFLSNIPRETIQPPDGRYFMLCGAVAPLFARTCRFKGELQKAKDLWETSLQYRFISEGERWPRNQVELAELLDAADVDARLGNLDDAIEKYMSVFNRCKSVLREKDEIMVRVAASLREARETYARRERNFQRAIATQRSTKAVPTESNGTSEIDNEEWELRMRYDEALNLFGPNDVETLQHSQALATYHKQHHRPDKEEVYRETIWRYNVASAGDTHQSTLASLYDLCLCYGKNGKLRSRLRGDLYLAPVWARQHPLSEFKNLLLAMEAPAILDAFNTGDEDAFWNLIDRHDTTTAICWASQLQEANIRDMLLHHFVNVDIFSMRIFLRLAIRPENGVAAKMPLKGVADVHEKDGYSGLDLHYAVRGRYASIIQALLENGVDIFLGGGYGETALHYAVKGKDMLIILMLLENRADVCQTDIYGRTALHYAVRERDTSIIQTLLEHGADISQKDNHGETALHYAARGRDILIVQTLLEGGADTSQKDKHGETALHYAASGRDLSIVQALLEHGANISDGDNHDRTALHHAARGRYASITQTLLQNGADISWKDNHGETALHHAARGRDMSMIQMLLEHGADISQRDGQSKTALHHAAENGSGDIFKVLLDKGTDATATDSGQSEFLHLAAGRGNQEVTQLLLDMHIDSSVENRLDNTALKLAFQGGHQNTTKLILASTSNRRDSLGQTSLHCMARNKHEGALFSMAVEQCPELINITDKGGRTALHSAATAGNVTTARLLLENGAECHIQDCGGRTPLDDALGQRTLMEAGSQSLVELDNVIQLLRDTWANYQADGDSVRKSLWSWFRW